MGNKNKKRGIISAVLRIILATVGGVMFGVFCNPYFGGIINIGNITGMVASVMVILYAVFFEVVNGWIKRQTEKKYGRAILTGCFLTACSAFVIGVVISILMFSATLKNSQGNEVLIVLGCKVNGESPSKMLEERLLVAKEYLDEHEDAVCIVSGGQGSDEGISEAECMYNWLVSSGIDEDRIYKEDKSTSTLENISMSTEILKRENLGTNVAIATNEFHIFRAGKVAEKNGLTYSAVPARTDWWLYPTYSVREIYGIVATTLLA
ncbi:Uncharacterized SAM-binding protein YcdF, DUF218 family [Lachnospiraceae bacterium NE2001]|jgi:uncharacterized SAM-binding protein YcdF (DUF218 family)|nr:Uncharacterized SAM-binding protein YcdF, DUF218 family [Lachnospiraceae bacterium NE2001]